MNHFNLSATGKAYYYAIILFSIIFLLQQNCLAQDTVKFIKRPDLMRPAVARRITPLQNGPDLVITNVTGVPAAITSLDANGECPYFFAAVTVKNIGNEDALIPSNTWAIGGESQYTNISAAGQITNTLINNSRVIKPNESWTATLAGKVKCLRDNPVIIIFEVDPQNRVREKNESNNLWSKSIPNQVVPNPGQKPDLIVQRVWVTPENPDSYSIVMIHVELKNIGAGSAVFCQYNTIWMSQVEGQNEGGGGAGNRVVVPNEVIGGGIIISESGRLANGCYRVFVKVDPNNSVEESNEDNNSYTAYLSIGGVPCQDKINEDRARGSTTTIRIQDVPLRRISSDPMFRVR